MKIAFDITVLYIAGAGVFYYRYNLLKALLALPTSHELVLSDYDPIVGGWIRHDPSEVKRLLTAQVAEVRRIKGLKHRKLAHVSLVHKYRLLRVANRIDQFAAPFWRTLAEFETRRRLRKHLADVEVFHASEVLNCALPHAQNVATIYDLTALLFPDYHTALVRELQAQKYRLLQKQANAVIAISESTRRDAVEHLGLDPSRVHVVYGGVDASYRPLPAQEVAEKLEPLGLVPQEYILDVGTIEPRKNLVRLIQAYDRVRRAFRPTPKLVLVGMKGWMVDQVLAQVSAFDLEKDVVFLGRVETELLPALYNGARLFVYPSIYEGFGLPVLEAMACGTPVITSDTSSLPEVAGDAAILVDPYDVAQIAEAIEQMLVDKDLAAALGQRGLERSARFTWEASAKRTLEVYEKIRGVG